MQYMNFSTHAQVLEEKMTPKALQLSFATLFSFTAWMCFATLPPELIGGTTVAPLVESVSDAVVNISAHSNNQQQSGWEGILPEQFQQDEMESRGAIGSGVIIDAEQGYVVTNAHVVLSREGIREGLVIKLNDGRELSAEVVGTDEETDLAVLKIEADRLSELKLADSDGVRVGDFVLAIGSPFGYDHTVTAGIVSALSRGIRAAEIENYIQTDAPINPGNSGGPLISFSGEIVGINTAIVGSRTGSVGLGFSIPSNIVQLVSDQLIQYGEIQDRGNLCIGIQPVSQDMKDALELDTREGAVISWVCPGSAAERAGIEKNDIILSVEGKKIADSGDLIASIKLKSIGDTVSIELLRDGEQFTVQAEIANHEYVIRGEDFSTSLAGIQFADARTDNPAYDLLDYGQGVEIVNITNASQLLTEALQVGDVIVDISNYGQGYNFRRNPARSFGVFMESVRLMEQYSDSREIDNRLLLQVRRGTSDPFQVIVPLPSG